MYRIRPGGGFQPSVAAAPAADLSGDSVRAAQARVASETADADADPAAAVPGGEAPTGRQLRMARRIAQKHGLAAASDQEAVAALRARGIDPFDRSNMLRLLPAQDAPDPPPAGPDGPVGRPADGPDAPMRGAALPAVTRQAPPPAMPAPVTIDADARAGEIGRIQRDIARRRRRRLRMLVARLAAFVGLPTLVAAIYFFLVATPLYATKSEFVIQQADAGAAAGMGGLFTGTSFATQADSISVQGYLLSRDAFQRLNRDQGFAAHFSGPGIDVLRRLATDASLEDGYALYRDMIEIGYDPTEGVLKMEVVAADPETSAGFSRALIDYAEEEVDQLTARLRQEQMSDAAASFASAEAKMLAAQQRVVDLQEQLGVVSADAELSNTYGQIGVVETALREERLRLDELSSVRRPNAARVQLAEQTIARLEAELAALREGLTDDGSDAASLARVTAELGVAQMDLQTRQLLLQQAAQQMEAARIEANRQVRYLSTSVPPIPPDEPTYPRAWQNTALALLVFAGIYLMVSLTVAILREQVSG